MEKIRVSFKKFKGEVFALFLDEKYNNFNGDLVCYASMGQHSSASASLKFCRRASKEEYTELLKELKRIGYENLIVTNETKRKGH